MPFTLNASVTPSVRDDGQTLVEYSLILALVSLSAVATLAAVGIQVNGVLTTLSNTL